MNKFSRPSEEDYLMVREVVEDMKSQAHELLVLRSTTLSTVLVLPYRAETVSLVMTSYLYCESTNTKYTNSTNIKPRTLVVSIIITR